jgi:acyl transferase domain-containing protein
LRDPQRMQAEQGRMLKFLQEIGADEGSLNMVARSADAFSIVRDAMRYRAAVKARSEKRLNR